jgi:uncharacterized protein YndB with AHSA1/START domain
MAEDNTTTRWTSDRIEKQILLRAPIDRVWRALSSAREFGSWFGVELEGEFAPGARMRGRITHPGYEHLTWDVVVERMEPPRVFSWRWHPHAIEPGTDYSQEPTTLVVFELEELGGGTMLSVVESGFERLPPERRDVAFRGNEQGWAGQLESIERYVLSSPSGPTQHSR